MKSFLSAYEIASLLNVDRATVTRWVKKGKIKGVFKKAGKQQWYIPLSAYQELAKEHESR